MNTNFIPNRLTAGSTGAGRFTFKTNSESDLELESTDTHVPVQSVEDVLASADRISSVAEWNDLNDRISDRLSLSEPEEVIDDEFNLRESAAIITAMDARGLELIKSDNFDDFSHAQITGIRRRAVDVNEAKGAGEGKRSKLQAITWGAYDEISALDEKVAANPTGPLAGSWKHESENLRYTAIAARTAIMEMGSNEE